jgi:hypothetical protein
LNNYSDSILQNVLKNFCSDFKDKANAWNPWIRACKDAADRYSRPDACQDGKLADTGDHSEGPGSGDLMGRALGSGQHSESEQLMSVELRQIMNLLHHEILHHMLQVKEGAGTKGPNPCWYPRLFGRQAANGT